VDGCFFYADPHSHFLCPIPPHKNRHGSGEYAGTDKASQESIKIAAKYKLDPTSASALKTYFAEVLGLKLHQVTPSYTLEKFEDKGCGIRECTGSPSYSY